MNLYEAIKKANKFIELYPGITLDVINTYDRLKYPKGNYTPTAEDIANYLDQNIVPYASHKKGTYKDFNTLVKEVKKIADDHDLQLGDYNSNNVSYHHTDNGEDCFLSREGVFLVREKRKPHYKESEDKEDVKTGVRKKQLANNIETLLYGYDNSINDGMSEPFHSDEEMVEYVYSQVFDLKDDGRGNTRWLDGVCDDLKYLGKEYIISEIKRIGHELGLVQKLDESEDDRFVEVDHKSVVDYDGFTTEYTWYKDTVNNTNVFVFGDRDIYEPEDGDYDWEESNDEAAKEWFDSFEGFNESDKFSYTASVKDKSGKGIATIKGKVSATDEKDAEGKVHETLTIDNGYKKDDIKNVKVKLDEFENNDPYSQPQEVIDEINRPDFTIASNFDEVLNDYENNQDSDWYIDVFNIARKRIADRKARDAEKEASIAEEQRIKDEEREYKYNKKKLAELRKSHSTKIDLIDALFNRIKKYEEEHNLK